MTINERFADSSTVEQERYGARRAQILAAASSLFAERGYHGASMSDIGERVGMLKGSLYAHIANKEEILLEIVGAASRQLFAIVTPVLAGAEPAVSRIRCGLRAHAQVVAADPDAAYVLFHEGRHLGGQPGRWLAATLGRYDLLWSRVFRDGMEAGQLRPDLDIDTARTLILDFVPGRGRGFDLAADSAIAADRRADLVLRGCLA